MGFDLILEKREHEQQNFPPSSEVFQWVLS